MNAIDHPSTTVAADGLAAGPLVTPPGAVPAPAVELIQRFQAALGRPTAAAPAGTTAGEARVVAASGLASAALPPGPWSAGPLAAGAAQAGQTQAGPATSLMAVASEASRAAGVGAEALAESGRGPIASAAAWTTGAGESDAGDDRSIRRSLTEDGALDAGMLASLAQAIAPLLLAVAPGSSSRSATATAAAVAASAERGFTATPTVAAVLSDSSAPEGPSGGPGSTPMNPSNSIGFGLAPEQAAMLPQAAADGRFLGMLSRVGVSAEGAAALLPALIAALGDRASAGAAVDRRPAATDDTLPPTLGAAMLQSLAQQSSGPTAPPALPGATPATAVAPTVARIEALQQTLAETVSRVLVSDPLHDGRREVRLTLAQEILPNTEIRLWRQDSRVHVEFIAPAGVLDRGFGDALPRLAEAIQQRQPQFDLPVVTVRGQGGFEQPGDGRSRQQYRTQEELEGQA